MGLHLRPAICLHIITPSQPVYNRTVSIFHKFSLHCLFPVTRRIATTVCLISIKCGRSITEQPSCIVCRQKTDCAVVINDVAVVWLNICIYPRYNLALPSFSSFQTTSFGTKRDHIAFSPHPDWILWINFFLHYGLLKTVRSMVFNPGRTVPSSVLSSQMFLQSDKVFKTFCPWQHQMWVNAGNAIGE